ncbi:MAG: MATE family efflux transporter, partial [Gammaproteobacteria bacterium]
MNNSSRVWALAWPLILSNITVPLLGLVDAAVLGHLPSPVYLAAVALGGQLFTTLFWLFGFLRMGTSGLSAQAYGGGRDTDAARLLWRGIGLGAGLGLLLILSGPWLIPAGLALLQADGTVLEEASRYAWIRIWGAPWVMIQYACLGWLVGRQRMRAVMGVAILANSVNVVLDLVLVLGLGMTTAGVALGTVAADICGALLALHATWRTLPGHPQLARPWSRLLDMEPLRELIRVNQHLFVRTALLLFTFGFFNAQSARMGDVILAANAILLTGLLVISNALDGFAHAAEALAGEAAGRRDPVAIRQAATATGRSALIVALLLTLFFGLGGDALIHLLTSL